MVTGNTITTTMIIIAKIFGVPPLLSTVIATLFKIVISLQQYVKSRLGKCYVRTVSCDTFLKCLLICFQRCLFSLYLFCFVVISSECECMYVHVHYLTKRLSIEGHYYCIYSGDDIILLWTVVICFANTFIQNMSPAYFWIKQLSEFSILNILLLNLAFYQDRKKEKKNKSTVSEWSKQILENHKIESEEKIVFTWKYLVIEEKDRGLSKKEE